MVQQTRVEIHYFLYPLISKRHVCLLPHAKTLVCSFRLLRQTMLIVICGTIATIRCDKSCQHHTFILAKYQSKLSDLSNISFLLTAHVNGIMHLVYYSIRKATNMLHKYPFTLQLHVEKDARMCKMTKARFILKNHNKTIAIYTSTSKKSLTYLSFLQI